jgi:hypothetical protein
MFPAIVTASIKKILIQILIFDLINFLYLNNNFEFTIKARKKTI